MNMEPTVFVVDDDEGVRDALSLLLKSQGLAVEVYASAQQFLSVYRRNRPGCLVLDVRMPQISGLELQEALAAKRIKLPIIFITGHGDVAMSVKALKAGAMDFVEKPFNNEKLLGCIREAIAQDARTRRAEAATAAATARLAHLTPREREVMALVVAGNSNKEIAAHLKVSPRTVEIHRARVMDKMGTKSLPELIVMAAACGIQQLRQ